MKKVPVHLKYQVDRSYDIFIQKNAIATVSAITRQLPVAYRYVVITDHRVKKLYGDKLVKQLKQQGLNVDLLSFADGEQNKNVKNKIRLEEKMLQKRCGRDTVIIALGGGVVGDIAGFVAATFMRGIPYVQVPTTLLAMVDSSVGGKTAIDMPQGKNLIGAIWQPSRVIIDVHCLRTLSSEHVVNGLIEAIKMFCTHDKAMFNYVEKNIDEILKLQDTVLERVIERAVKIKAGVVSRDERESNERMVLNFGHTIGHAIEKLSNYRVMHGEAVGLGMLVELQIAELMGEIGLKEVDRVTQLLEKIGINRKELKKYTVKDIIKMTRLDKKSRKGVAQYVILDSIGTVKKDRQKFVHSVDEKLVKNALIKVIKG